MSDSPLYTSTGPSPGASAPPYSPAPPRWATQEMPGAHVGPSYGIQQRVRWAAGESDRRPLGDIIRADSMWRVSVIGDVDVWLRYGSSGGTELLLAAPLEGAFAGFVGVEAEPREPQTETLAIITIAPVSAGGRQTLRSLVDSTPGAVALPVSGARYRALQASTLTVRGVAVVVPALAECDLLSGSVLLTGVGVVEHES